MVFDVTSAASLASAQKWLARARAARPTLQAVLVGNKTDLTGRRVVAAAEAEAVVASNKLLGYYDVSAVRCPWVPALASLTHTLAPQKDVAGLDAVLQALAGYTVAHFDAAVAALLPPA